MTRRAAFAAPLAAAVAPARPNVLVLLTDQQTYTAWSGSGNAWLRTPAMDSIARRGRVFSQAIYPYPVCSPSRSSLFTGRMAHEIGVMGNSGSLPSGMASLGELFRAAGYQTAYGGKWHLPKSFAGMTGFDRLIGGSALGRDMDGPLADTCADWLRRQPAHDSHPPR